MFWNSSGIKNLQDLINVSNDSDILCISETWHLDINKVQIQNKYRCFDSVAIKTADRGRPSGGLMILLNEKYYKNAEEICKNECYIFIKFTQSNKLIILGVTYINQTRSVKAELEKIEETLSIINNKYKSAPIFLGGDFNARIKNRGTIDEEQLPTEAHFDLSRESLDQIINKRGQELLNFGDRNEFFIVNGRFAGDQPAKYTYVGTQGSSVIDLVLCNVNAIYSIKDFKVQNIVTK